MAPRKRYKGVERHEEFSPTRFRDDVRTPFERLADAMDTRRGVVAIFGAIACFVLFLGVLPGIGEVGVFAASLLYLIYFTYTGKQWRAPYRVPGYVNTKGEKFLDDSTGKAGEGDIYLGWEPSSGLEVWALCDDYRTHRCVLGTTGSGKTEELLGALFNALILNSGAILVDGKASPNTYEAMFRIARFFAREEDLLVLNYIMGGKDIGSGLEQKISHTYNPLSMGSSAMKSELMVSLLDQSTGGNSDMWQGRAISFLEAIIPPLSFLADRGYVLFNPQLLINYFQLPNIENLIWFGIFTDMNGNVVSLKNGTEAEQSVYHELYNRYCGNLRLYVSELPAYGMCKPSKPLQVETMSRETYEMFSRLADQQAAAEGGAAQKQQPQNAEQARQEVLKQHGFITMQLVRATGNLTFNYGHIYNDEIGEISFRDALLNRRILLALIPGLERTDATMAQLGKMAVASIKSVMGTLLDTPFEGTRRRVIEGLASNAPTPYIIMLDEYGYYVVKGFAVVPAQARSFGVSITFGSQAFTDLLKGSKEEGEATWANTNLKHAGRLRVGSDTEDWKRIEGLGGRTYLASSKQLSYNKTDIERFKVGGETSLEQVSRIDFDDVTQQQNGEFHLVISKKSDTRRSYAMGGGSVVVRYQAFYTGALPSTLAKDMRFVHYVQVKQFSDAALPSIENAAAAIQKLDDLDEPAIEAADTPRPKPDIIDAFVDHLRDRWRKTGDRSPPSRTDILSFLSDYGVKLAAMRREADAGDARKTREHQANAARKLLLAKLAEASPKDAALRDAHIELGSKVIDAWVRRRIDLSLADDAEDVVIAAAQAKGKDFFRAVAGRM